MVNVEEFDPDPFLGLPGSFLPPGISLCSDCGIALVSEKPREGPDRYRELFTVFSTANPVEAAFIQSLLNSNGIESYLQNQHLITLNNLYGNALPVRVMVDKKDETAAGEIIAQYDRDQSGEKPR